MSTLYGKAPMVIVYKNTPRSNAKTRIKVFRTKNIDHLIDAMNSPKKKLSGIPKTAVILQVGIGKSFESHYRKKYKL